jgi:hypothetical protein
VSGSKKTISTSSTTENKNTVQGPEPWMKAEGQSIYSQLKPLAEREWQGFDGERVAELGGDWQTSRDMILKLIEGGSPDLDTSRSMLDSLRTAEGNDPNKSVQDYMNPYIEGVLGGQLRDMGRTFDQQRLRTNASATMAGAFGDSGHGLAAAEDYRNHENAVSDASYKARADGFDKAQNQQNTVLQRLMALPAMYQGLDASGFNRTTALSRYMNDFGKQDQAVRQAQNNVGYSDFLEQRGYKANNLNALIASLNGIPHDQITDSSGTSNSYGVKKEDDNSGLQILGKLGGTLLGGMFGGPAGAMMGGGLGGSIFGGGGGGQQPVTNSNNGNLFDDAPLVDYGGGLVGSFQPGSYR